MVINWYGQGCFKIQSGELALLIDPFSTKGGFASGGENSVGLTPPRFKADITVKTFSSYPLPYHHQSSPAEIVGPGEYEIRGVAITGWPINHGKSAEAKSEKFLQSVYSIEMEEINIGVLGALKELPDASILEELGQADFLIIPAGGSPYIRQEQAAKLIKQINPKIVLASFFKVPGLKEKIDDYKDFLKELSQTAEPQEKLTIKKKELPASTKVVVLKI